MRSDERGMILLISPKGDSATAIPLHGNAGCFL
jgi:hypothetical protein